MNPSARRNTLLRLSAFCLLLPLGVCNLVAADEDEDRSPFVVTARLETNRPTQQIVVHFAVPAKHHLYADQLWFEIGSERVRFELPAPVMRADQFSAGQRAVYEESFDAVYPLPAEHPAPMPLQIGWRGCSEDSCFLSETHQWVVKPDDTVADLEPALDRTSDSAGGTVRLTSGFRVLGRAAGYLGKEAFLQFLARGNTAKTEAGAVSAGPSWLGLWATLGGIFLGGLALNLTPCVPPMIPINLALLGAGNRNADRRRGFLLGTLYGIGMTLAYGGLGLAVVLTGAKFGALNSSPWFNIGIAVVFLALALAMFDVLAIDLSRFQRGGSVPRAGGGLVAAAAMGVLSALLAGACVAPEVISVLLLATTFYQQGQFAGLLLPFLLGLGMALPWPFAGAGLSFLPKPGAWMTKVKCAFGLVILGFAAWYGWLGWGLAASADGTLASRHAVERNIGELRSALDRSQAHGRPVLVDFWAGWCKNCSAMEHTTFRDPTVQARLRDHEFVRFQAESLSDTKVRPILDEFGVLGLPTYVLLAPERGGPDVPSLQTVTSQQ